MNKVVIPFLSFAGECMAHPGHGAPIVHTHGWDWPSLGLGIVVAIVAAVALWRSMK